ncbi:MAG: molybdate ABC transporter substrate-binding protein [Alphaproteobacteria bacterium]|nr:molybdate ABC transporter substrate-binding protein [Alphaproteobacteria bacterium]
MASTPARAVTNLTVMADNSASIAVAKLARDYARANDVAVSTSFVAKSMQSSQILEGGSADILITQDAKWIDELQLQGLIDIYSKTAFARGRLALIGPADSTLVMKLSGNFFSAPLVHAMHSEPLFFLGNPEYVPDSRYAREALRNLGALDVLEPYTLYLKSYDQMVEQVTQRGGYAVFSYGQALLLEKAKIIDVFPEKTHSNIPYYVVVIAGDNMEEARKFIRYLGGNAARNALRSSGMSEGPV